MRRLVTAAAVLCLLGMGLVSATPEVRAGGTYLLPAPAGTTLYVTQGNFQGDHNPTDGSQYAFDFAVAGSAQFPVAAARAGSVLGMRSDSTENCDNLSCWTEANYVLVDQGDGTAALYLHLATGSVVVHVGQRVAQGEPLATADDTGYSDGTHLHFQVENTPTPSSRAGWWWTQSLPVAFADPSVLQKVPSGVPTVAASPYVSSNATPQAQLAAPAAVTLVSVGDLNCAADGSSCLRGFTIAWAKVTGATGYNVYLTPVVSTCDVRQYVPLTAPQLAMQLPASATRWSSTVRLLNGHYALYSVVATNKAGKSPATVANRPVEGPWGCGASTPPPTPTGLSFTEPPCSGPGCVTWVFRWHEAAGVTAAFRLYDYWTGEGPGPTCAEALPYRRLLAVTSVGSTSWSKVTELSTGGGQHCVWIQAFNSAGASGFAAFPPGV